LAQSINNLGAVLYALGYFEVALKKVEEAVMLYRELAAENSKIYNAELAVGLETQGRILSAIGRHEEALAAFREAVQSLAPYFLRYPQAYGEWMYEMLKGYLEEASKFAREPERELVCPLLAGAEALRPELSTLLSELCQGWKNER